MTWYNSNPRKLYHKEFGIPTAAETVVGKLPLERSQHALRAAKDDRYGNIINLPRILDTSKAQVIEVEMEGDRTTKVLYRVPYSDTHDLVLAVMPDGFVKTVWLNAHDDLHNTLDASRYEILNPPAEEPQPEEVE